MNKTSIILCTMIIILVCSVIWTESWAEDCNKDVFTQTDMNLCAIDLSKKTDLELDAVYKKLMKKISPKGQAKLRAAQSAWIVYRKKQCEFNTLGYVGGTVHSMVLSYCHAEMANQQKINLLQQLECEEGDHSCGHQ